jgi:hypothetical protein
MTRFSIPALATVSVLALGLIAAPASIDLQDELIGAKSAWAKGGNGGGNGGHGGGHGGGNGGGHGHGQGGQEKAGKSDVSSVDTGDEPDVGEDDEEGEEEGKTKTLPDQAIAGKTNSSAFNSANYGLDTVNPNSAVAYSKEVTEEPTGEEPTGEEPTGEEPTGEEPTGEEPTGETPVVDGEDPATDPTSTL